MTDKSLNKTELVAKVAASTGLSQTAVDSVLNSLFETVSSSVSKDIKVSIPGWLAFERTKRDARTGINPRTREQIKIPEGYSVKVTAGSKLKAAAK